jgi:tetratricopeptide (TPR) repeat protein
MVLLFVSCASGLPHKTDANCVPKSQYEEFLKKHEDLVLRYERLKDQLKDRIQLSTQDSDKTSVPVVRERDDSFASAVGTLNDLRTLVENESYPEAIRVARLLSESSFTQVAVRAKFYLGEALFRAKDYDLAMQVYEEIINQSAFSGVVLKTMERLVVCAENLKLESKRARYYSLLHDFFETT